MKNKIMDKEKLIKENELLKSFLKDYINEFEENGTTGWERYDKAKELIEKTLT